MNENTWAVIGNVELFDLEQALGVDIGLEKVETFTGLVFNELGRVPNDGDQVIELEFKELSIQISRIENHQIAYAKVTKLAVSEVEDTTE